MFIREGQQTHIDSSKTFTATIGKHKVMVSNSSAGIVASPDANVLVIATAKADVSISGPAIKTAEEGIYLGNKWQSSAKLD